MTFRSRVLACTAITAWLMLSGGRLAVAQPAPQSAAPPASQPGPHGLPPTVPVNVNITYQQLLGADQDPGNWLLYGRTYDNQRFSPLDQINTNNVGSLVPVATIQTGVAASFEVSPVVVNGIMFISTPYDHVMAYDATNGKQLWSYTPELGYTQFCCGPESRGVAVVDGKVYLATLDAHLIALNAYTGEVVWNTPIADSREAFSLTMAPQVYDGKVIIGTSGAEYPTRNFVAAYDGNSGKEVWRFYTTAAPDQPGGDSWSGDSWKTGGGSIWNTPAIDPARGLVIFATGNPNPDNDGSVRLGANAYTDSIVAVDIKTGKLAWWYQQVPHDVWDYDATAPVVLLTVKNDQGQDVPAAAEAGKVGQLFIVNRDNGRLIRKSEPFVMQSATMWTPPPRDGYVNIYPGAQGGNEWSPEAYSPKTGLFYIQGTNESWEYTAGTEEAVVGHLRLGGVLRPVTPEGALTASVPAADKAKEHADGTITPSGTLSAVNVDTGKIDWQYHSNDPMLGGVAVTAGNLVFAGEFNGQFDAFNAKTGEKLWHYQLGSGVNASPVTYMVRGRQYVAVAAGGNAANGNVVLMKKLGLNPGDTITIFAVNPPAPAAD